jgi:hypothetical protein
MKTWFSPIALLAIAFTVGCGGTPAPTTTEAPAAAAPTTKPARGAAAPAATAAGPKDGPKDSQARADEIIADLRKREAEQGHIQQRNRDRVPVVVEVTPGKGKQPSFSAAPQAYIGAPPPGADPAAAAAAAQATNDANFNRQEVSIAQARLTSAEQKLQAAQARLSAAQQQTNGPNEALRKMGQSALQSAQQEVYAAQNEVSQARYALDSARSRAGGRF